MNYETEKNDGAEDEKLVKNEEGVAFGEIAPIDRLQNQIRLAENLYEMKNGPIDHQKFHNDVGFRNNIMLFWSDGDEGSSYSAAYRRLEDSDWFKNHPELNGDIFKIKIEHLLEFIELEKSKSL